MIRSNLSPLSRSVLVDLHSVDLQGECDGRAARVPRCPRPSLSVYLSALSSPRALLSFGSALFFLVVRVYISPPGWHKLDKGAPPPYNPLGGPSAHNQNPMASRSPTWSTYLVVSSLKRLVNHMVVFLMANMPYLPSFRSLAILHGLKEAPVVLWIGPEHLGKGCPPQIWLPHGHIALSIQFQIFRAAP